MVHQTKLKSYSAQPVYSMGVRIPRNHTEAMEIDRKNGDDKWQKAEKLELEQIDSYEVLEDLGVNPKIPEGYRKIKVHFVYNVKHDGRYKARLVSGGHLTEVPPYSVTSSVVSLRGLRIAIFIAELNGLQIWATDVGNAYLEAPTEEKVYIVGGLEFRDRVGHTMLI